MDRNKRTARTLTAALCLALLAGCGAETAGESLDADEMHPGWSTVTTDPSAYGITYQELEDLSGMPLDQLTAYCLGADGVYRRTALTSCTTGSWRPRIPCCPT